MSMSDNVVGLRRMPAKVNLNRNNKTGTWSDHNVASRNWERRKPVCYVEWGACFSLSKFSNRN